MDLLLWRHAEAADGRNDLARPLTRRGHEQARVMAKWLRKNMPEDIRILVSPARRAQETAAALESEVETIDEIAPDAAPAAVIAAAGWPDSDRAVLIVGHQPTLGQTAALILGPKGHRLRVRKGSVIWLKTPGELVVVMEPDMLKA